MTKARKRYIEQWWRKYEVMNKVDADLEAKSPPARKLFFELVNSAHRAWRKTGKINVQIEADIEHHIAMQKVFKKWREVHGGTI